MASVGTGVVSALRPGQCGKDAHAESTANTGRCAGGRGGRFTRAGGGIVRALRGGDGAVRVVGKLHAADGTCRTWRPGCELVWASGVRGLS